jgi:hypothetical protein
MTRDGYPILSRESALLLGNQYQQKLESVGKSHLVDELPNAKKFIETRSGPTFDFERFDSMHTSFEAECLGLTKEDQQEIFVLTAAKMLEVFPHQILQDLDFWRYLSIFHFRKYIIRVRGDIMPSRYGGDGDGQIEKNWPLIEGLRWAWRLVYMSDSENVRSLSVAHKEAGLSGQVRDQYLSNLVRPKWGSHVPASHAFLTAALSPEPIFDLDNNEKRHLNRFQQRVARTSHNILFEALSESELEAYFKSLREPQQN